MVLVGDVTLIKAERKEYDGRVYFSCLGVAEDKEIYKFSCSEQPKEGDKFQMVLSSSMKDLKPYVRFEKIK